MFYELIYTRCRQGIDILKKGQPISSDGYKVYSCSPAIMEEGKVDLQFLANAAQAKQSFTDPGFMEDAYLYYKPDTGPCFFVNFFPVLFDKNATGGDYARRPGNFINHAIIGDFSSFYPYELFKDERVWTAKTKGEAFYYENPPAAEGLPERGDINAPSGQYSFDEIKAFVKDGREEALKKAVAFIISQYNEEPKNRKFLVIKEDSSKNIELWIAAIECAFSPKIASGLPFATRMDKFNTTNKYTTKNGLFQTQINLQDPNHIQRYRAMIVGVHEQDKANMGLARPLGNSPFAVLDGKQKKAEFEADISNPYFQFIVRFDDKHGNFCRKTLQIFDIKEPGIGVLEIFEALSVLGRDELPDARQTQIVLDKLSKYKVSNPNAIKSIYDKVNANLSRFLQEDLSTGLKIINWLQETSKIVGDNNAKQNLTGIVCDSFAYLLFNKSDNNAKKANWELIKGSDFCQDVAKAITDLGTIDKNKDSIAVFDPEDTKILISIYIEAASKISNISERIIDFFLRVGIIGSCRTKDNNAFKEIVLTVSKILNKPTGEFQFQLLKNEKITEEEHLKFIANYIIEQENVRKPGDVEKFIKELQKLQLENIEENALAQLFDIICQKCGTKSLLEPLLKMKFSKEENETLINALSISSDDYFQMYLKELIDSASKFKDKWNFLFDIASENETDDLKNLLVQIFKDIKIKEKELEKSCKLLDNEKKQKYFAEIAEKVLGEKEDKK